MRSGFSRASCCALALSLAAPSQARGESPAALPAASNRAAATGTTASSSALAGDAAALAREAFAQGLRLVKAGDFSAAQSAFARAHELEPHPLSLYNIGQCQARLRQFAAAVETLQRFIAEAGDTIDPAQRQAVVRQISELQARVPSSSAEPPAPLLPPLRSSATEPTPLVPPPPLNAIASSERSLPWGWLLGGAGIALVGSATALYFWNDGRYTAWRTDRDQLESIANREQLSQQDAAVWEATHASNERLASIQRVDVSVAITAGVGAVALGFGIWRLLAADDPSPDVAAALPLAWRLRW